jgi:hypothetical protein
MVPVNLIPASALICKGVQDFGKRPPFVPFIAVLVVNVVAEFAAVTLLIVKVGTVIFPWPSLFIFLY